MTAAFQRARRPEQVAARREAILNAAAAMLGERPVADISLRELAGRVGLAKSNVLRYFDSREAIFLEVLDRTWTAWLDGLSLSPGRGSAGFARETRVATAIATSLIAEPLLCELFSTMGAVLERNISLEVARDFKTRFSMNTARLAGTVRACVPALDEPGATHFAGAAVVVVAGLWPFANPTEVVATVSAELGAPCAADLFSEGLTEALVNQLIGLVARAGRASDLRASARPDPLPR
ncbi:MAG: TetR family transcriptional regulator [Actinophytocola sp.]|uniref:TetR family transcriptional regulator n=1 Tax=Actinophytocola sp. TaxID=1872138 RepID=UPI0013237B2B|nr:TetR family transcriptional regulator [Actinophytocola sp.]MPZ80793.1 TetR family transcriptional regulator [Actinophytocola sp.]